MTKYTDEKLNEIKTLGRVCTKCNLFKIPTEFYINRNKRSGRTSVCRYCQHKIDRARWAKDPQKESARHKRWGEKNPGAASKSSLKSRRKRLYGVTHTEFEKMLVAQNNKCKLCNDMFRKTPHVDHNHKNKKVRGLLCGDCNCLLGFAHDNTVILRSAITYLEQNNG